MSKQFWAILAVIVVVFLGITYYSNNKDDSAANSASNAKPTNHVMGKGTTGVTLVEYGDFQCPVCGTFFATTKQVQEKYSDQITFQFRNLPLTSLHPNAFAASRAAEAAGLQGQFWEMHDLLYQNQTIWSSATNPYDYFAQYAKRLSLNLTKFQADYKSTKVNNAINADVAAFDKTGNDKATPTYFLNDKKIPNKDLIGTNGQPSVEAFSRVIDEAISAQKKQ